MNLFYWYKSKWKFKLSVIVNVRTRENKTIATSISHWIHWKRNCQNLNDWNKRSVWNISSGAPSNSFFLFWSHLKVNSELFPTFLLKIKNFLTIFTKFNIIIRFINKKRVKKRTRNFKRFTTNNRPNFLCMVLCFTHFKSWTVST